MSTATYRRIERVGNCRGCKRSLEVGTMIGYAYEYRKSVILCDDCLDIIFKEREKESLR